MTRLKRYLANGFLMTCVALLLRGLAVIFNAYISKKIGAEALGLYTLLGSVYSFALTLALSGINLTVTRLVSDALGKNNPLKVRISMKKCIGYSLFFGILSATLLLILAEPLSIYALKDTRVIKPLRLCAATLPLISLSACFNGYFNAVRRVYKNAISQISEQLARIFFCVTLLNLFVGRDMKSYCIALVLGGALAEMLAFTISLIFYVFEKKTLQKDNIDVTGCIFETWSKKKQEWLDREAYWDNEKELPPFESGDYVKYIVQSNIIVQYDILEKHALEFEVVDEDSEEEEDDYLPETEEMEGENV